MKSIKAQKILTFFALLPVFGTIGFIAILLISTLITSSFFSEKNKVVLADGYTISKYDLVLDVKEDNKIFVNEDITVNWEEGYHHGIYKFTPEWLEYTNKKNETLKRKSFISYLKSSSDPYSIDYIKKKARIRLGDPYSYVDLGEKTYNISYIYNMGKDPYKNFDEFIFHAYGDYWGTEIKNPSLVVKMPKSIEGYKINFFLDKYRKEKANKYVDYKVKDNVLTARFNQEKYLKVQTKEYCKNFNTCDTTEFKGKVLEKALTVNIELPEGYFVGGSWNYGYYSLTTIIIIFILTIFTIYNWIIYGKDFKERIKAVEFYPPKEFNSAEVGFIYGKKNYKKLSIALIIQLASKGYIKIDEAKITKDIQITNLYIIPKSPEDIESGIPNRAIEVKKIKESDEYLTSGEKTMMKYLFKDSNEKKLETNIDKFLNVRDSLASRGYIQVVSDNEQDRYKEIEKRTQEYEKLMKEYNSKVEGYKADIAKVPGLSKLENIVYNRLFESGDVTILSTNTTFYKVFKEVADEIKKSLKDYVQDKKSTIRFTISIIITILVAILSIISYSFLEDLNPVHAGLYSVSFLCILVNLFFTIFMKRRTKQGQELKVKIEEFRDFLIKVEKPKLEELVSQNPRYFYDILPYTYVLNISKKWISKFENIQMEKIDMGTFNYSSDSAFSDFYYNIYEPSSSSGSSSSGGSSCGGGCSSCGGGCSSCGGGGSW